MSTDERSAKARFDCQVKAATRTTGIAAGAIATVAYPAWGLFDYLVEPATADDLLWLRLGFALPIALLWLGLWLTPHGHRHPELFVLGIIYAVDLGIALMIAQIETHYASYALGMSLTIYAGAFLLIWSPRYMLAVIALNLGSLGAVLLAADPIASDAIATVFFYVGTASLISFFGQYHRHCAAWREFEGLLALEREQERSTQLVAELDRQSREDPLTGLANRRAWDEALARQWEETVRTATPFTVVLFDLDGLKSTNDRYGHATGDRVIKALGRTLKAHVREGDVVARLGGDEFGVLSPGGELCRATRIAERLRAKIRVELSREVPADGLTVSVGVAEWESEDNSAHSIMLRSDRHLYHAKATRDAVFAGGSDAQPGPIQEALSTRSV